MWKLVSPNSKSWSEKNRWNKLCRDWKIHGKASSQYNIVITIIIFYFSLTFQLKELTSLYGLNSSQLKAGSILYIFYISKNDSKF